MIKIVRSLATRACRWRLLAVGLAVMVVFTPAAWADIIINVLVVNGAPQKRDTPIKYTLPAELKAEDILDTDGLTMDYNVNEGGYFLSGTVPLDSKASKTFRVRVKDVWKVTPQDIEQIKSQIENGAKTLTKPDDADKTAVLKDQLLKRLDFIYKQQTTDIDTADKRVNAFRIYADQLNEIKRDALAVDYWRSTPGEPPKYKTVRLMIDIENPKDKPKRTVKEQHYLPAEIKPENVIDSQGFDFRFDKDKEKPYLYKEEDFQPGDKKHYEITLQDIWNIDQHDLDYLKKRSDYAYGFLKESKYQEPAKILYDRIFAKLGQIEATQAKTKTIDEHIGTFRTNQVLFKDAEADVEALEKLLAIYREELEKSRLKNILQKIRAFKSLAKIAAAIFKKKLSINTTWKVIGWILGFVALYTFLHFIIWWRRSVAAKKKQQDEQKQA